jgi:hypothetical protein
MLRPLASEYSRVTGFDRLLLSMYFIPFFDLGDSASQSGQALAIRGIGMGSLPISAQRKRRRRPVLISR